mmetsp:Transcript_13199/g.29717  ORF Transcript_13199/g.29717 Transcript_13199/m.29717 type:complete len:438 (-) Transcript_13199:85-1398(-)
MRSVQVLVACALLAQAAADDLGCTITAQSCVNFPQFRSSQFRDAAGEAHLRTASNEAACLKRAEDFHHWCGNDAQHGAQVAVTFNPSETSMIYHPDACEQGWSQYGKHCYKHFWENRNWFEAEALCNRQGGDSHLASIHSKAENQFIFTLSLGLSAWIGYVETEKETFQWSDSSQDDFQNLAKNCTGREHEPDCKPEERASQWYNHYEGSEVATYICKKSARQPVALMRNISAADLLVIDWLELLRAQEQIEAVPSESELVDVDASKPILESCKDVTPQTAGNATIVEDAYTCRDVDMAAHLAEEQAASEVEALKAELAHLRQVAQDARSETSAAIEDKANIEEEYERFRNESDSKLQEMEDQVIAQRVKESEAKELSSLMSTLLSNEGLNITLVSMSLPASSENTSETSSSNCTACEEEAEGMQAFGLPSFSSSFF